MFKISVILFITLISVIVADQKCDKLVDQMDNDLKTAILLSGKRKIPKTDAEITNYCGVAKTFSNSAKQFRNCTKPLPKQLLTILAKSSVKTLKRMCKKGKNLAELKNFFECMTPEWHNQTQQKGLLLVNQIQGIITRVETHKLPPLICCSFTNLIQSIKFTSSPTCKNASFKINDYLSSQVEKLTKDLLEFLCSKWSTAADCLENEPELVKMMQEYKLTETYQDKSLVGTVLQIAETMTAD